MPKNAGMGLGSRAYVPWASVAAFWSASLPQAPLVTEAEGLAGLKVQVEGFRV